MSRFAAFYKEDKKLQMKCCKPRKRNAANPGSEMLQNWEEKCCKPRKRNATNLGSKILQNSEVHDNIKKKMEKIQLFICITTHVYISCAIKVIFTGNSALEYIQNCLSFVSLVIHNIFVERDIDETLHK